MSKLAIFGGDPVQSNPLPEFNTLGKEEIDAATKVINSGTLSGFVAMNKAERRYKNEDFKNTEKCWKNSMLATNICR
jgi:flagellar motor switch protein FliM